MVASAPRSRSGLGLTLALLAFAEFMIAIDYNIVYVALPDIGRELGFTTHSLQWVVSAYAVTFGGLLLLGGRAADRLGARRVFVVAVALYGLSSLLGGLAGEPWLLITARAVQGVGGALLFPTILTLINTTYPAGAERTRAMAAWGAAGGGGLAAGALAGGLLTNYLGWDWVFFVNVPVAALILIAAPRLLPADTPRADRWADFDLSGGLLATAGVALVVFGLVSGPDAGWLSLRAAGAIALGAVLVVAFAVLESRLRTPLLPPRLLRYRSLTTALLAVFVFSGTLSGEYYLFTTYLQGVLGYSPLKAGLAFLPLTLISMAGAGPLATTAARRLGYGATLALALLLCGIGIALLVPGMSTDGSYVALLPGIAVWGIGGGIAFTVCFAAAGHGVAPEEQGVANAVASTSQQIGSAVGLAAIVAVASSGLDDVARPAQVVHGLRVGGLVSAVAAAAVSVVIALFLRDRPTATPATPDDLVRPGAAPDPVAPHEVPTPHPASTASPS
ncbi:putative MFS transporter protein [Frankia sp. AiPs1]|uniref:MFS transporter n=1 Tax=Frankia sp. AiPa1 TaxID=573492 RepID=UPI00202BA38D|nr:MFS transporter [Frankia sp. AiPa1]MCL9762825.1 MFS transporter [Frankia sp. AiPa1]